MSDDDEVVQHLLRLGAVEESVYRPARRRVRGVPRAVLGPQELRDAARRAQRLQLGARLI